MRGDLDELGMSSGMPASADKMFRRKEEKEETDATRTDTSRAPERIGGDYTRKRRGHAQEISRRLLAPHHHTRTVSICQWPGSRFRLDDTGGRNAYSGILGRLETLARSWSS